VPPVETQAEPPAPEPTVPFDDATTGVVFDGPIDKTLVSTCEQASIPFIVGMSANATSERAKILTAEEML